MRQFYLIFENGYALRSELSWTHYRLIMRVENKKARQFYLDECVKANWSTRQLERQINSFFYERLLSSQEQEPVRNENFSLEQSRQAEDIIRDPYVIEFLGLKQAPNLFEKDLEQALIAHLQKFLLELGRGFSFVARKQRISFDGRHFFYTLPADNTQIFASQYKLYLPTEEELKRELEIECEILERENKL